MKLRILFLIGLLGSVLSSCGQNKRDVMEKTKSTLSAISPQETDRQGLDTATFGEGCFWCSEAFFKELDGVEKVLPGYSGGHVAQPTYEQVCSGTTGHVEVSRVIYDPKKVSFGRLLEAFWGSHDPTTLNRQGNDVGTQYRSVIFYHNNYQKGEAERYKAKLQEAHVFKDPIVTTIEPLINYYPAEDYHKDYYENNPNQPYCQFVLKPKLEKFRKVFHDELKSTKVANN